MNPQLKQTPDHYATCNGCGIGMTESEIKYTSDDGHDYCNDCNDAIQSDDESSGRLEQTISKTETVTQASYRLVPVKNISWDHNWNATDANKKEREGFIKGANWQSQQAALGNADTSPQHSYSEQEQWVSVKDRLPNEGSHVLILYKNSLITDAFYEYESGQSYFFDKPKGVSYWEATHWMPLPAPPKQ